MILTHILILIFLFVCILIIYVCKWRDYKLLSYHKESCSSSNYPRISILLPCKNEAELLRKLLPQLAEQNYPNFEIIVIDEASDDETLNLVDHLKTIYPHIRSTYLPKTANHSNPRKMSITLGVKAARGSWCLLIDAHSFPTSTDWLKSFSSQLKPGIKLSIGFPFCKQFNSSTFTQNKLLDLVYNTLRSSPNGSVHAFTTNVCFDKHEFLNRGGFSKYLSISGNEGAVIANLISEKGNTVCLTDKNTFLEQSSESLLQELRLKLSLYKEFKLFGRRNAYFRFRPIIANLFEFLFILNAITFLLLRFTKIDVQWETDVLFLIITFIFFALPAILSKGTQKKIIGFVKTNPSSEKE